MPEQANVPRSVDCQAQMLIRRPAHDVFEAFVDPAITSRFWWTKGSARLEPGKTVRWQWEMFDLSADIKVKAVEKDKRILIEWETSRGMTPVEWIFHDRGDGTTLVTITNKGVTQDEVADLSKGFAFVISGAKAWLEHGIRLDLVADAFPDGHPGT